MTTVLPDPSVLAEEVRGTSLADVAGRYEVTHQGIVKRLNAAGYTQGGQVQTAKPRPIQVHTPKTGADDLAGALCREDDPEVWFADGTLLAKYVCKGDPARNIAGCPVREQCLRGALERREEYGVFGGLDAKERRALLKSQGKSVAA